MKRFRIPHVVLAASLVGIIPGHVKALPDSLALAIKASLERSGSLPTDESLYATEVSVSHNWDVPRLEDRHDFVRALVEEIPLFAKFMGKATVTRFFQTADTVVITARFADAQVADGESAPQLAYFIKVKRGHIVEEQVFADRGQFKKLLDAMRGAK